MEPYLRKLGLPSRLEAGVVTLLAAHTVCTEGEALTSDQAKLLQLLGIKMAVFKLSLKCRWAEGEFESTNRSVRATHAAQISAAYGCAARRRSRTGELCHQAVLLRRIAQCRPSLPQRELVRALVEGGPIVPRGGVVDSGTAAVDSARGSLSPGARGARGPRGRARRACRRRSRTGARSASYLRNSAYFDAIQQLEPGDLDVRLELGGASRRPTAWPVDGSDRRTAGPSTRRRRRRGWAASSGARPSGHVDRALRVDRVVVVAPPARLAWACADGEPGGGAPRDLKGRPPEAGAQVGVVEGAVGAGAQLRRAHQPARALQLGLRAPLWVPRAAGAAARRALPHGGRDPLGAARAAHQPRRPLRPPAPLPPRRARRRRRRQRVRARPLQRRAPRWPARLPRAWLCLRRDRARRNDRAEGAAAAAAQGGRADRRAGLARLHAAAAAPGRRCGGGTACATRWGLGSRRWRSSPGTGCRAT